MMVLFAGVEYHLKPMSDLNKYWATRDMYRQSKRSESAQEPSPSATALLRLLFSHGPMPVSELLKLSDMSITEFGMELTRLQDVGLIVVEDRDGVEVAVPSDQSFLPAP
jgi:hypothetical protein